MRHTGSRRIAKAPLRQIEPEHDSGRRASAIVIVDQKSSCGRPELQASEIIPRDQLARRRLKQSKPAGEHGPLKLRHGLVDSDRIAGISTRGKHHR